MAAAGQLALQLRRDVSKSRFVIIVRWQRRRRRHRHRPGTCHSRCSCRMIVANGAVVVVVDAASKTIETIVTVVGVADAAVLAVLCPY